VAAIAIGVVVVIGLVAKRMRSTRTRNVGRPVEGGPSSLRFTCAGCSQQFTQSRRTLAAWRKGGRQFLCNACNTKRSGSQPRR
jgi:predicted SprT family Zn-dependent metalloprotease